MRDAKRFLAFVFLVVLLAACAPSQTGAPWCYEEPGGREFMQQHAALNTDKTLF